MNKLAIFLLFYKCDEYYHTHQTHTHTHIYIDMQHVTLQRKHITMHLLSSAMRNINKVTEKKKQTLHAQNDTISEIDAGTNTHTHTPKLNA